MKTKCVVLVCLLTALISPAFGTIINGGFETGTFGGWETLGDASVQDASIGTSPTEGNKQAFLSTLCGAAAIMPPGSLRCQTTQPERPYSDTNAVETSGGPPGTGTRGPLFDFLGVDFATDVFPLLSQGVNGEGSAIRQTFDAEAGNRLSFDYNVITNETPAGDYALLSLVSRSPAHTFAYAALLSGRELADVFGPSNVELCRQVLDPSSPTTDLCGSPFVTTTETGYQPSSLYLPFTGSYTLGFSVFEVAEGNVPTVLSLDNIHVLPEPPDIALFVGGLAAMAFWLKRKRL